MDNGIFNPFEIKTPKKVSATSDIPLDTEYKTTGVGDLRLDGGKYVIVLKDTRLEDLQKRLGLLMSDVQKGYEKILLNEGVYLLPPGASAQVDPVERALQTPSGWLVVFVGNVPSHKTEDEAFNRLGHVLHLINNNQLFEQHNVKIIVR